MPSTRDDQPMIRLDLKVSRGFDDTLGALAEDTGMTRAKAIAKAVALFELAWRATKDGKRVGIAAPGQALETEVVGIGAD